MYEELERFHEEADRDLERRVTAFLADRNLPALRRLGVRSHRGVITLRGQVRSFYEKQLGGQSARRVAGVIDVIDAIQVASDSSLLSVQPALSAAKPTSNRQRRAATAAPGRPAAVAPVVVSFESHRANGAQSYGANGAQSYGANGAQSYGANGAQSYGANGAQSYGANGAQSYGANGAQSYGAAGAPGYTAGGLDPISQAKG